MSSSESEDWECPLCMEEMDIDDRGFFPCECGYQICRFCHNRISQDYGGRCPACRRLYSEQTPKLKPISAAQVAKIKNEKKAKEREKREIEGNNRRHLANVRVVQKNLVYVIGLPISLATEENLRSSEYFGQFGRINKIVINRRQAGSNSHHPTVGVYVTYATKEEATKAINTVDGSMLDGRVLRATFGTTKYCSYYLRNIPCQNPGCMYLHEPGEEADSFTKEDLAANRAGLRDGHENPEDNDDSGPGGHRDMSRSPNPHLGSGRVVVVPATSFPGFHNSRPQTTAPSLPSAASHSASARIRKVSELNGSRPRSVEPHTADSEQSSGSALPATASWASKPAAKKPAADSADGRPRRSETGTMTLRMVPSTRNKAAAASNAAATKIGSAASTSASSAVASGASASGPGAAGTLARERSKAGAAAAAASSSSSTAAAQAQHHPMLQQLSRERKQQLRHQQTRTQQKAVEAAGEEEANGTAQQTRQRQAESALVASVDSQSTAANRTSAESTPSKKKTKYREVEEKQQQAAQPATQTTKAPSGEESMEAGGSNDQPATSTKDFEEGKRLVLSTESRIPAPVPATPGAIPSPIITQQNTAEAASAAEPAALNHTSSAQSFQSIAESLVAQLNAKVSTPTSSTIPAFPSASGFDSRVGGRVAGFPVSGVDPLLFPPSAGGPPSSLFGRTNSGLGAPVSSFDPFANPAASPWGGASTANSNPYGHSPLSALLTDAGALSPSLGGGRDAPTSAGLPSYSSRQRSRWDFALADEASAQAELQSVLGRGFGSTDEHISELQQPQNAPSFASSRDLGLFSTPAPVGNGSAPTWGRHQPDNAAGQQQPESGSTTPFPPPGFGKAGTDSLVRLASSTPPTSLAGGSASIGAGPNTLLSRLIGQTGTSLGTAAPGLLMSAMPPPGIGTDISANTPMPPPGYYQQQHAPQGQFQDPAILSSYMAATAVTSATGSGAAGGQHMLNPGLGGSATANQQQHQQHQQSRTDPIVLNSLLARLHLGGRDSDNSPSFINSNSSNPLGAAGQQPSSSIMPPGLMQTAGAASSPLYAGQLGNVLTSGLGHQNMAGGGSMVPQMAPSQGQHSGGFVDPAIMHIGRLNAASAMGVAPTAPVGPPPGIMSPPTMEDVHGQQHPQQTLMPSRSANSSGRSRFLNHFSADPAAVAANIEQQRAVNQGGSGAGGNNNEGDDDNDKGMPMVNGVPPGLPTTGLFGELLRRAKQDSMASSGSVAGGDAAAAGLGGGNYVSGRMMVGDIERKIGEARKEARELQVQLGSAIERNQPTLWALRNGGSLDGAAASSSGIKHISM